MAELHPGPDVSLGQLEAQLRNLGLRNNQDFFYAKLGGEWALTLSDENYERWQAAHGGAESEQDTDGPDGEPQAQQSGTGQEKSSDAESAEDDEKADAEPNAKPDPKADAKPDPKTDTKADAKAAQQRDTASGRHKTPRGR